MSSTKQKKTSTRSTRVTQAVHVDTEDDGFANGGDSALSPTFRSRQEEKNHLSHLNDRLAGYIERVRQLEAENARLTIQIRDVEVFEKREKTGIRDAYEAEIAEVRKLLDATSKEKARVQIEADKARAEFTDLKDKINKLEKDLKVSETSRLNSDSLVQDLQARVNTAENRRKHAEDEAKKLRGENDSLQGQLSSARRQLEEETLLRVDLENRMQSLREELDFHKQLYSKELEEMKRKRTFEMTSVSKELETEYQAKLQEQLSQMRAQFDAQIAFNRGEIENMFRKKMDDSERYSQRMQQSANDSREEMTSLRARFRDLEGMDRDHQKTVDDLNKRIKDLESQLNYMRDEYGNGLRSREDEINRLREEIRRMTTEYQDLMDTKIQLDVELQAYQKLLESEENRLHLTPASSPTISSFSPRRSVKRKRVLQESDEHYDYAESQAFKTTAHADGDVEIEEQDKEGMFIRLRNKGDEEASLGSWSLRSVGGEREVSYKFHPRQSLKPAKTLTIWSANSGKQHSPPTDLVMKNQQWPSGDSMRSVLVDVDGEEAAWRESRRQVSFAPRPFDAATDDPDQRCSIM